MPGQRHRIFPLPYPTFFQPEGIRKHWPLFLLQRLFHFLQQILRIRPHRHLHMERGLFQLRGVHIHHDHKGFSCPAFPIIAHLTDGQAVPHRKNQIRILHRKISCPIPHDPPTAYIERIFILDQIDRIPAGYHGNAQRLHHTPKDLIASGQTNPVSCIKHRPLCPSDPFNQIPGQLHRHRSRQIAKILLRLIGAESFRLNIHPLIVYRNIHPGRTLTPCHGHVICLLQYVPDIRRILQHHRILAHMLRGFYHIKFLISHGPQRKPLGKLFHISGGSIITHLTGNHQHGNGVQPAPHHSRNGIGASRTCGHAHRRYPVFRTGIGLRRHSTCLFMVKICTLQTLFVSQCIIQVHGASSNHSKTIHDSAVYQKFRHIICQTLFHNLSSSACPPDTPPNTPVRKLLPHPLVFPHTGIHISPDITVLRTL